MKILKYPDPSLKVVSSLVDEARFGTDELHKLAKQLIKMMESDNGIGLAAPQVGIADRIIAVDMKEDGPTVFVNPKIVSRSLRSIESEEGCLSVPGVWGIVDRHKKIKVKAYSVDGKAVTLNLRNLYSTVFQHEIDHLDGVLFIEKTKRITRGDIEIL